MAGNYNDPEARIHYDSIGIRSWRKAANAALTTLTEDTTFLANMNNESGGSTTVLTLAWSSVTNPGHPPYIMFEFPRPVNLDAIMTKGGTAGEFDIFVSDEPALDSSSWTTGTSVPTTGVGVSLREWARTEEPTEQLLTDVRTLRIEAPIGSSGNRVFGKILLFGSPADVPPGPEAGAYLSFWKPVSDAQADATDFEFGDIGRMLTQTKQIRVKNRSTVFIAAGIELSLSSVSVPSPPTTAFYNFSLNEVDWVSTLTLGDLDPEEISPLIYIRQQIPVNAILGLSWVRLRALADSWEE